MTTKEEKAAAEEARVRREDLAEERRADELVEAREDAAAERKVGASRVAAERDPFTGVGREQHEPPLAPAPDPVVIAHFTAKEALAIEVALRDAAKDPAVRMLLEALKRGRPRVHTVASVKSALGGGFVPSGGLSGALLVRVSPLENTVQTWLRTGDVWDMAEFRDEDSAVIRSTFDTLNQTHREHAARALALGYTVANDNAAGR